MYNLSFFISDFAHYITAPTIFLPYIVCFLFHLANWSSLLCPPTTLRRLISLTHHRSPQWLRHTLAWCWPNIGFPLHIHRLLMLYLLALGFFPPSGIFLSLITNADRAKFVGIIYKISIFNNVKLLLYLMCKILLIACENYDLRVVVLVAFLLDGPVWYVLLQSLEIANALEFVICTEAIIIFTQVLLASLRKHYGRILLAQSIIDTGGVGEPQPASSISLLLNKKGN